MNFFAIISILSVLGAMSVYSLTGTSGQTYQEQERSTNIIRGQFEDNGQTTAEVKKEVKDAKILVRSEKESNYTTLVKIGKGNEAGGVTVSVMSINEADGRLLYLDQNTNKLDIVITFEPAKAVLGKDDRNRLFTIGYCEELKDNTGHISQWMVANTVELDLDKIYREGCSKGLGKPGEGTNMIRVVGYNSFKLKGNDYNVHFTYNKDVFYQIEKDANVEIKNLELLTKDMGQMSDFSIGNNYITQFQ